MGVGINGKRRMGEMKDENVAVVFFFQATRLMNLPRRMKRCRCSGEFAPIIDQQYLLVLRLSTCRVTSGLTRDKQWLWIGLWRETSVEGKRIREGEGKDKEGVETRRSLTVDRPGERDCLLSRY